MSLGAAEARLPQASQPHFSWCYQGLQRYQGAEPGGQLLTSALTAAGLLLFSMAV